MPGLTRQLKREKDTLNSYFALYSNMPSTSIASKIGRSILFVLKLFAFLIFTLICSQYFRSKYYRFPDPVPFTGNNIFNPYSDISGKWLKSNFHAHTKAWGGLTNGHQTKEEIMHHYQEMKYDVPTISNYHQTVQYLPEGSPLYFPVYEHGNNIGKTHHLVFGNEKVCYFDIALWQSLHNKQSIIEHLAKKNPLVSLNHPSMRNSYKKSDLQKLTGYQLMEVINTPGNDEALWDVALSAGKISWIIADDDCHDIRKPNETGVSWTMVNAKENKADVFLESLKNGLTYGVTGHQGVNRYYLKEVKLSGNEVLFRVDSMADEIRLIGQDGVVKKTVKATDTASYSFAPNDSYIRAVIKFPDMTMYLNPLIRYDGKGIPRNEMKATAIGWKTISIRVLIFCIWLGGTILMFRRRKRRKQVRSTRYEVR